ncbi:Na+/H+ antiporter NhaA [Streptomyces telluris]|uniref:Na+/H+ antiporter NhaA n=1 Tax=Streptomyces telluris TaxID=2720021 RepID=UPI0028934215|nr:Na+/H+ antiporter NhaA [Streptomyces telluris]
MCAVLVLAIAYTTGLNLAALSLAAAGLALFGHLQNGRGRAVARVRAAVPGQLLFGLLAAVVRALTHASGVHATIAGVAMGLLMRTRPVGGDRLSPSHRTAPHRSTRTPVPPSATTTASTARTAGSRRSPTTDRATG